MMTPLALEMLIWLRTRGDLAEFPTAENRPQRAIVAGFIRNGVCSPDAKEMTPLGHAWLTSILATPLPEVRYIDARTNEVLHAP